jgi:hypothetical protein
MEFITNRQLAALAGVTPQTEKIQPGPVVYSRTHTVVDQFPRLATFGRCSLVTSFSDSCVTDRMAAQLPPNVEFWFSNNVMTHHPRVIPVPLGVRSSSEVEATLQRHMDSGRLGEAKLAYSCFSHIRQPHKVVLERRALFDYLSTIPWVTQQSDVDLNSFYAMIRSHSYVFSPPGAGPDCHRHWESLLLGSIPIVARSRATDVLRGLPCVQVDDWGQVSEPFLIRMKSYFSSWFDPKINPSLARLDFGYWRRVISGEMVVVSCGVPRTGSTLTWQILNEVFPGQKFSKTHPAAWVPSGEWLVVTVRHPLDTVASHYRMRLVRAEHNGLPEEDPWLGIHTVFLEVKRHLESVREVLDYPRLILLRYEDFVNNYGVIFDAYQTAFGITISQEQRNRISASCGLEANRKRGIDRNQEEFDRWQIHTQHVGTPEPGGWRSVIPVEFHERFQRLCSPLCEEWGYES